MTVELTADRFKVHASEKVSTGDYETFTQTATVEGDITMTGDLSNGRRKELRARLLAVERDLQKTVQRAAENRLARPDAEDWSEPPRDSGTNTDD